MLEILQKIVNKIPRIPLILTAERGHGKTEATKTIVQELMKNKVHCKIFDCSQVWIHKAPIGLYKQIITDDVLSNENWSYLNNCVYDLSSLMDSKKINLFLTHNLTKDLFERVSYKMKHHKNKTPSLVYIIEESQSVIGSYSLRRKKNWIWNFAITTGRNFGLSFIFITPRLAKVSAEAVELCGHYLLGKQIGDNNKSKIRRLIDRRVAESVEYLKTGNWIYFCGKKQFLYIPMVYPQKSPKIVKPIKRNKTTESKNKIGKGLKRTR